MTKYPTGISSYIASFYPINYLQHCIPYTAVHTNDTDLTQQVGDMNKLYRLQRIECVRWCVFVFVFMFHRTKHGNIALEQGLREIFGLKTEGVAVG